MKALFDRIEGYVPAPLVEKVKNLRPGKAVQRELDRIERSSDTKGWKSVASADFVPEQLSKAIQSTRIDAENPTSFCVLQVGMRVKFTGCRSLADRWMEILGKPDIPFSSKDRQEIEKRVPPHVKKIIQIQRDSDAKAKKTKSGVEGTKL